MKVLHTIPYFNKTSGGPTSCTYNLLKGLNSVGTATDLLTFQPSEEDVLASDRFIHYLPDDRKTPLWLSANFAKAIENLISGCDIVHVNTIWTWPSHKSVSAGLKHDKPVVLSPHGMLYPQALKVSAWKKKLIAPLFVNRDLRSVACIHATSEEEAKHIKDYGIDLPVAVIPNCICMDEYPQPRKEPNVIRRFGFTGRLNPIKNVDLLLKAWGSLGEKTKNAELLIIGDGESEYVSYLKRIVSDSHCLNVKFCGFLSGKELTEMIHSLDYQILPSKSENFGMVVAEALACGVPAITSVGTPWQILEQINAGWWIEPMVDKMADAILYAMNLDEAQRSQMGLRGREYINGRYSSISVADRMTQLYNWILNKTHVPDFVI